MKVLRTTLLALFAGLIAVNVSAQSRTDLITAYNNGTNAASEQNYDQAISAFTQAISIGEQLGAEGQDIVEKAKEQIPKVYYQKALSSYRAFQSSKSLDDLNATIDGFGETAQVAVEYGSEDISRRARGVIPQLYYQKGLLLYNQEDYTAADNALDEAIRANSNYAQPYYQKGLIVKKTNREDIDTIINWFNQAINIAEATNKEAVARKARESAHDELLYRGAKATEAKRYDRAIELLEMGLGYDENSADLHYRLAEAYNKKGNATKALEHANKSLELENGGRTDKAKIYFEIGLAHQTLENTGEACSAFGNAVYGSFKAPAEHIMEFELKCKSS